MWKIRQDLSIIISQGSITFSKKKSSLGVEEVNFPFLFLFQEMEANYSQQPVNFEKGWARSNIISQGSITFFLKKKKLTGSGGGAYPFPLPLPLPLGAGRAGTAANCCIRCAKRLLY